MMHLGKKLLSLLTVFCLTLSLLPTVALAAETSTNGVATEVTIKQYSYGNGIILNNENPYLSNDGATASKTKPSGGYAYFQDGTLELYNYTNTKGIYVKGDLTIKLTGTNKVGSDYSSSAPSNAIMIGTEGTTSEPAIEANLTITGDGTLTLPKAQNSTIFVNGDLTINGGATVNAKGGSAGQAIDAKGNIIVDGTNTKLTATKGNKWAIQAGNGSGTITVQNGAKITSDLINVQTDGFIVDGTAQTFVENQEFASTSALKYGITIGYNEITSYNKGDVLGDGKVSYDPATSTLTLNNATITDIIQKTDSGNLTINVVGENRITTSNNCIHVKNGNLTITKKDDASSGTLIATASSGQTAIYVNGDITINNGVTVTAKNTFSFDNNSLQPYGGGNAMDLEDHNLTITGRGTNVTAEKLPTYGFSIFSIYRVSTLTVADGATLTSRSTGTAIAATNVEYPLNSTIEVSSDANAINGDAPPATYKVSEYKYVHIQAAAGTAVEITPAETPNATFNATGTDSGTLSGVTRGMQYKIGNATTWTSIDDTSVNLTGLSVCTIYVKQLGDISKNKADSDSQLIKITKARKPNVSAIDCTTSANSNGKITGLLSGTQVEYQKEGDSIWTTVDSSATEITDLTDGTYLVRVKANGTVLASASVKVTVNAYRVASYTVNIQAGNYMNKDSGDENQTVIATKSMNDVIYKVANGYYFPEEYGKTENGITVERINYTEIKVSGTPTGDNANITISLDNPTEKTNQDTPTSTEVKFEATSENGGQLTVPAGSSYEYSVDGGSHWMDATTEITGVDATKDIQVCLKETDTAKASNAYTIDVTKADAPTGLAGQAPTSSTATDGKITGVNNTMEYQKKDGSGWTSISEGTTTMEGLAPGTYQVRVKASGTMLASASTEVTVSAFVSVTSITLDKDTLSMKVGESNPLTATITPENATNKAVTWTSDTTTVATVDESGKVTAVGVGTATITVKTTDGNQTASCTVTVTRASSPGGSGGSSTTYYPVNIPADSEGGSVAVSPKSASRGSTVTVTVTPASGYQVDQVQAVDKDGNKLTLTEKGDGKYTFVMPNGKVDVSVAFSRVQQDSPYSDVSKDSYYYDAVQWATDQGITNGVAEGLFAPDWACTRGQIVTFLWRSMGSPAPKTAEMPFADVAENAYYAQAVLWAVENGITKGTSETTFSPEQTCTRAHAVAFLYRLAGSPAVTGSRFQDVAADAYYSAAVAWAVEQGITNGTSETTFGPDQTCTRAQIVTFLYRMDQSK